MEELKFNPDIELDRSEQSALASIIAQPGFKVIQKIGKACVDQFVVDWINQVKEEDVIRAHHHAKVAAQFYTMLVSRIKNEVDTYINTQPEETPVDVTEGILDIGEYVHGEIEQEEALFE
jgi:hypothetical protein